MKNLKVVLYNQGFRVLEPVMGVAVFCGYYSITFA